MNSRTDLLDRLRTALDNPESTAFSAPRTFSTICSLLGALDDKVVFSSMNRGGLAGASFELDDRMTGYTAAGTAKFGMNGGKMLLRIALDDAGTLPTMTACAEAVDELAAAGLIAMLERFSPAA